MEKEQENNRFSTDARYESAGKMSRLESRTGVISRTRRGRCTSGMHLTPSQADAAAQSLEYTSPSRLPIAAWIHISLKLTFRVNSARDAISRSGVKFRESVLCRKMRIE